MANIFTELYATTLGAGTFAVTTFTADTITEKTPDNGVDLETVHFEDGAISNVTSVAVDTITEKTADNGVDIETCHLEDGTITNLTSISVDTINEKTADNGVSIDGVALKDSGVTARVVLNNSFQGKVTGVAEAKTLDNTYHIVACTTTDASYALTLPACNAYPGIEYVVVYAVKGGAYTITIQRAGADTIDDALTSVVLSNAHDRIRFTSLGGTVWYTNI